MCPAFDVSNYIGKIVTNLQSLEFTLRMFLNETEDIGVLENGTTKLTELAVGEWVPENHFTNYDALGKLIEKVNRVLQTRGLPDRIDESIVELRDGIAHGRVLSLYPNGQYRILKFSRPIDGRTKVEISIELTKEWLSQQIDRTYTEIQKVVSLGQSLGLKCFLRD